MPAKPNLLFVIQLPPRLIGGAVLHSRLLSGLVDRGYGAHAIVPIDPAVPAADRDHPSTRAIDIQWLELEDIRLDKRNPASMDAFYRDSRAVTAVLPEAIARTRPAAIVLAFSELVAGIPNLAHAHGIPCIVIAQSVISPRVGGAFRDDIAALLLDEYRKADGIIAIADHIAAGLDECGISNVASVPNSVDAETFRPGKAATALRTRLGVKGDDIVVLHASNMVPVKRTLDIVAAAKRSLAKNRCLRFVFVGDGLRMADTRQAARDAGVLDRTIFASAVDHTEMPAFYRLADMVLMPSQSEGLSLTCLEALSAGSVLLASDIPAAREIVADGDTGFLFPVGDIAAIGDLIVRVAADPDLRDRIGRNARAWSLQRPSEDDNITTFATLFDDIIAAYGERTLA